MNIYLNNVNDILGFILLILIICIMFMVTVFLVVRIFISIFECILNPLKKLYSRYKIYKKLEFVKSKKGRCTICLEQLDEQQICKLNCDHYYHTECIVKWLVEGENICPLCRNIP